MNKIKIGIDARLYSQTGVGVYIRNLLYYLQNEKTDNYQFYIYLLKKDYQNLKLTTKNFIPRLADYIWHTISEQTSFLSLLNNDDLDLVHFTYFSYPIFYNKPFVITVHDLTPLLYKTGRASTKNRFVYLFKHKIYQIMLRQAILKSQTIITPSRHIKNQICHHYQNINSNKITITYEGVSYELINQKPNNKLKEKFNQPFFISVGNFYPHKNIESLIKAFEVINKFQLILIGPDDYFAFRVKRYISNLGLENKIIIYHDVPRADLVFFYQNAKALIFPSLSEGFGLPLLEAKHFGCPIIASDIDVFKEIIGNNYYQFDPTNIAHITQTINKFINEKRIKKPLLSIGSKFSFKKMSQKTFQIYQNATASSPACK